MKLLSYNIRYGGVGREHLLAAVIRRCAPDLVILQEATRPVVVERLAAETGLNVWGAMPGQSLAFLSRTEVARREWHLPRGSRRAFLEIVPAAGGMTLFGLHLSAVHSKWTERRRMRELRAVLAHVERQRDEGLHVLTGDFNTLAPGELLDTRRLPPRLRPLVWLSGGRVKYETIQIMHEARYVDAYRLRHPPADKGYTFPTWDPHVRLDYFFLPESFAGRLTDCRVINDLAEVRQASDHFPLAADIDGA
ncbi:MAG TPA: endonuclease/exonuclease/phosphatase family protein [Pyrinomonadaceae bacterium]|nr:endonuclease/exonuclease/phosphatase family protein [Pyrinomonadaceae bacterium]